MVYQNIKDLCEKQNISIAALEKKAGLGNGTIGNWKKVAPNLDNLQAVASVLKVDVKKLIG